MNCYFEHLVIDLISWTIGQLDKLSVTVTEIVV